MGVQPTRAETLTNSSRQPRASLLHSPAPRSINACVGYFWGTYRSGVSMPWGYRRPHSYSSLTLHHDRDRRRRTAVRLHVELARTRTPYKFTAAEARGPWAPSCPPPPGRHAALNRRVVARRYFKPAPSRTIRRRRPPVAIKASTWVLTLFAPAYARTAETLSWASLVDRFK